MSTSSRTHVRPILTRIPPLASALAVLGVWASPASAQSDGFREAAVAQGCYLELNQAGDRETWVAITAHGDLIMLHQLEFDAGMAADLPGVGWRGLESRPLRWVGDRFAGAAPEAVGFNDPVNAWRDDRHGAATWLHRVPVDPAVSRVTWTEWMSCGDGCQRPVTRVGDTIEDYQCAELLGRIGQLRLDWGPGAEYEVDPFEQFFVLAPAADRTLLLTALPGGEATIGHVSTQVRYDTQFRLVPGLAGGEHSFESLNHPGHYLRHTGFKLFLHPHDGSQLFAQDATFRVEPAWTGATGAYTFRSVNFPDRVIVHVGHEFLLLTGAEMPSAYNASFRTWVR